MQPYLTRPSADTRLFGEGRLGSLMGNITYISWFHVRRICGEWLGGEAFQKTASGGRAPSTRIKLKSSIYLIDNFVSYFAHFKIWSPEGHWVPRQRRERPPSLTTPCTRHCLCPVIDIVELVYSSMMGVCCEDGLSHLGTNSPGAISRRV